MRAALAGEAPDAGERRSAPLMRLGYLGPGRHVQRGGAARRAVGATAGRARARSPTIHEAVMAVARRRGRPRARADRELARGRGERDARRAGLETRATSAIVGERVLPDPPLPDRPRADRARRDRASSSRTRRPLAQCARFLRDAAAAAPRCARPPRPPRPSATVAETRRRRGPRSARARAAERYGCRGAARGRRGRARQRDALRVARRAAGSAPRRRRRRAARGRRRSSSAGAGRRAPGWLVRCLSEFAFRGVNLTRIESRPRSGRLGHYMFLRRHARAAPTSRAVADAIAGAARRTARRSGCSGTYPAA